MRARLPAPALSAASAGLATLGLWLSFRRTFAQWGVDSDVADTAMLWEGWRQHGWAFLRSWYYTQDNWILSLLPIDFAAFAVLGPRPVLVVASGWAIFAGCAGMTALLAWRIGGRTAALWLLPLLLLSGQPVLGKVGFLSYPVTHNISLLWGLLSVYAAGRWLSGRAVWLVVVAGTLLVNVASDPWATAAFLLPALLAPLLLAPWARGPGERARLLGLAGTVLAVSVVLGTRLFGLFGFVAGTEFAVNDWAGADANLLTLGQVLPLMFSTYPGLATPWAATTLASSALLAALCIGAARPALAGFGRLGIEARFVLLACVLSCGGVLAAFLLGRFSTGLFAGRLLLNVYVFVPLLLAVGLPMAPAGHWVRRLGAAAAMLMMLAGIGTEAGSWRRPLTLNTFGAAELARFLEQNGLHYGYGAYWGTQSNAVTWLSGGRVRIRAVAFAPDTGRIYPRLGQTSALWYRSADLPPAGTETFVVVRRDEENCADVARCRAGLIGQFGAPSRELTWEDAAILVWPGPLLGRLDRL